jgi:hypothetical protein
MAMTRWVALGFVAALGASACERQTARAPATEAAPPAKRTVGASGPPQSASAPQPDPASCVTYDAAYEKAPLMRVRGAPDARVNFFDRAEACPASGACGWRSQRHVVGGEIVFVSAPVNGFHCAYAGATSREIVAGFVPADRLEPVVEGDPLTAEFLVGAWRFDGENSIAFREKGGRIIAEGSASYGQGEAANLGAFEGPVTLAGATLNYSAEGCEVTALRRGPYLVVDDNGACGGLNVAFDGIYVRAPT